MDIPVSRLNERMAMQLPAELPLGLVYVVGTVQRIEEDGGDGHLEAFLLTDGEHGIRCRLTPRAGADVHIREGDLIRAGGHLAFETAIAAYYLLARDIEVLQEYRPGKSPLSDIIASTGRRSRATGLVPAQLPSWIKEMAPPDLLQELEAMESEFAHDDHILEGSTTWDDLLASEGGVANTSAEAALAALSDEVIDFLSSAMDSSHDVELTPGLVSELHLAEPVEEFSQLLSDDSSGLEETVLKIGDIEELINHEKLSISDIKAILEESPIEERTVEGQPEGKVETISQPIAWYWIVLFIFMFLLLFAVAFFVFVVL